MTAAQEAIESTTTTIELQDTTWRAFAEGVLGSIAKIVAPIIKLVNTYKQMQLATMLMAAGNTAAIAPTFGLAAAVNFLMSPVVLVAAAVAACAAVMYYFSGASDSAAESVDATTEATEKAVPTVSRLTSMWESFKAAVFTDGAVREIGNLQNEFSKLMASLDELRVTITQPFIDGEAALIGYLGSFVPLEEGATLASSAMRVVNFHVDGLKASAKNAQVAVLTLAAAMASGGSQAEAAAFVAEGQAITSAAEASAKLTATLEGRRAGYQALRAIQEGAEESAARAAEVANIASITTLEGIKQKTDALRAEAEATIIAGQADSDWEATNKTLFDALEKQRQGIINGTVVDKAAAEAKKDLAKVEAETQKIIADAAEADRKRNESGAEKIQSLRDEIDLLTGAATKAEIAMRDMAAAGFKDEQTAEVGRLMEELDRLKKEEADAKKPEKKSKDGKSLTAAAEFGSKSALSIIANASAGRDPVEKNTATIAKEATKTNKNLETLVERVGDFSDISVVELPV